MAGGFSGDSRKVGRERERESAEGDRPPPPHSVPCYIIVTKDSLAAWVDRRRKRRPSFLLLCCTSAQGGEGKEEGRPAQLTWHVFLRPFLLPPSFTSPFIFVSESGQTCERANVCERGGLTD